MGQVRKLTRIVLSAILVFGFIQTIGGYLIGQLSSFQNTGQVWEQQAEEQIVRQMVLQLEPTEYYTIQIGSYENTADGQEKIDALAQLGYRVCVSKDSPYCIWLGCFGKPPQIEDLPEEVQQIGSDIFVQKRLLNETALRFPAQDGQVMEQIAALLSSYDIVLKHSLQMFQDYRYAFCSESSWNAMIQQITEELKLIQETGNALLADEASQTAASSILDLQTAAEAYEESLQLIQEKQNNKVVLLAQSCLLELIEQYHTFMDQESHTAVQQ